MQIPANPKQEKENRFTKNYVEPIKRVGIIFFFCGKVRLQKNENTESPEKWHRKVRSVVLFLLQRFSSKEIIFILDSTFLLYS